MLTTPQTPTSSRRSSSSETINAFIDNAILPPTASFGASMLTPPPTPTSSRRNRSTEDSGISVETLGVSLEMPSTSVDSFEPETFETNRVRTYQSVCPPPENIPGASNPVQSTAQSQAQIQFMADLTQRLKDLKDNKSNAAERKARLERICAGIHQGLLCDSLSFLPEIEIEGSGEFGGCWVCGGTECEDVVIGMAQTFTPTPATSFDGGSAEEKGEST